MLEDTAKSNSLDASTYEYTRQLMQRVNDLIQVLRSQQDVLRQRGMNLSPASLEHLKELTKRLEGFTAQTRDLQTSLRHLRELAKTTELINSSLDTSEVLTGVIDTVIRLTGAERGFIMLKNRDTGEYEFTIARGIDQEQLTKESFTVSRTIINQVALSGQPELTNNASDDPRHKDNRSVIGFALRSIMAVPLKVRDEIIGVIYCDNRFLSGVFKQAELDVLVDFANQAAVAIENARLYESARMRLAEVRETSELLTNVLESIASGVITVDASGLVNTCNAAAETIIEKYSDEVIGKPLVEALPPDLDGGFYERLEIVRQVGAQETHQCEPVLNGERRTWHFIISPLRDYSGQTQGVALVLDDLTAIKQRQAQLSEARRYLPGALVENILNIDVMNITGEEREISSIFADVRGFTSFSERLQPEVLMEIINKYLSLASDAINLYDGVVDKYMGDAVTGLFNTQLNPQPDHAVRVVRAALAMRFDLYAVHEVLPPEQRLFYGIGIHSGKAILGNAGSPDRREFAAIGDAIETSKILQENAAGGEIIISEATYTQVQDYFECEAFQPTKVKHRTDITLAYKVLKPKKGAFALSLDDF